MVPPITSDSVLKEIGDLVENILVGDNHGEDDREQQGEDGQYQPKNLYDNLEKAAVLQDARLFHDNIAVRENPVKCCQILCQLLRLQDLPKQQLGNKASEGGSNNIQYQALTTAEATDIFFGCTKLFVSSDASLRRLVYLFIKEVYVLCNPNDVIIVTSCLTKDMACDIDLYRANALRVLSCIIDSSMLGAIERYVKQAIVDHSPYVASAALVSAIQLFQSSVDCAAICKRWITETQQAIENGANPRMMQFHGIAFLYLIKAHDRLGVSKLISQYSAASSSSSPSSPTSAKSTLLQKSPLAAVCLIRYTSKLLHDEVMSGRIQTDCSISNASQICRDGFQFLQSCLLTATTDIVVYEAARAICTLPNTEPEDLHASIQVLNVYLTSDKSCPKLAAIQTLALVANRYPRLVSKCQDELQRLISNRNKTVATLAVTTLLKTGTEDSISELLPKLSSFMRHVEDEYRIIVVQSLRKLCLTYPHRHEFFVSFLYDFLRNDGGFEFKNTIVSTIATLMKAVPESTTSSLFYLADFIEDCEYMNLSIRLIHLIGDVSPTTEAPARYIPYIYNRILLEKPEIRAAAVMALSKIASQCPSLRTSILVLLEKSLIDDDDETRDRAIMAVSVLKKAVMENPYIPPNIDEIEPEDIPPDVPAEGDSAACAFATPLPMSFEKLERSMKAYVSTPSAMESSELITLEALPIMEDIPGENLEAEADETSMVNGQIVQAGMTELAVATNDSSEGRIDPADILYKIPELASFGRVFRSCTPVQLTESETEYVVHCTKHMLLDHVILQFAVENTIDTQRLDNVRVSLDFHGTDEDYGLYEAIGEIAASDICFGDTGNCFTILKRNVDVPLTTCSISCELKFMAIQVDATSGDEIGASYEEEFACEDFDIATSDYIANVSRKDFRQAWESAGDGNEVMEKFSLPFKKENEAVAAIITFLGMEPCDGTRKIQKAGKPHMLHLSGVFVDGRTILARAQVSMQQSSNNGEVGSRVVLKIAVRSEDSELSLMVINCIN